MWFFRKKKKRKYRPNILVKIWLNQHSLPEISFHSTKEDPYNIAIILSHLYKSTAFYIIMKLISDNYPKELVNSITQELYNILSVEDINSPAISPEQVFQYQEQEKDEKSN